MALVKNEGKGGKNSYMSDIIYILFETKGHPNSIKSTATTKKLDLCK